MLLSGGDDRGDAEQQQGGDRGAPHGIKGGIGGGSNKRPQNKSLYFYHRHTPSFVEVKLRKKELILKNVISFQPEKYWRRSKKPLA